MQAPDVTPAKQQEITLLLNEMSGGNAEAFNRLVPLVYDQLRDMAHRKLEFERDSHTLNTTALVHEAYLRLVRQDRVKWQSRAHFYAIAAQAMRRILVNYAVKRKAKKRGGDAQNVPLEESLDHRMPLFSDDRLDDVISLDQAMTRLESFNERGCRVVEYRFFGGLIYEEIAEVMDVSTTTVRRAWSAAKSWLRREMRHSRAD